MKFRLAETGCGGLEVGRLHTLKEQNHVKGLGSKASRIHAWIDKQSATSSGFIRQRTLCLVQDASKGYSEATQDHPSPSLISYYPHFRRPQLHGLSQTQPNAPLELAQRPYLSPQKSI